MIRYDYVDGVFSGRVELLDPLEVGEATMYSPMMREGEKTRYVYYFDHPNRKLYAVKDGQRWWEKERK